MSGLFKSLRYMLPFFRRDTNLDQKSWEAKSAEPKKNLPFPIQQNSQ